MSDPSGDPQQPPSDDQQKAPDQTPGDEGHDDENPPIKPIEDKKKPPAKKPQRQGIPKISPKSGHLPQVTPHQICHLKLFKQQRIRDWLTMEDEFINNCETVGTREKTQEAKREKLEHIRGKTMIIGSLEEMVDDNDAIVSFQMQNYYVPICSFVDRKALTVGVSVLLHEKTHAIVGILDDDTNPLVDVMKVENAPLESYADIGGLEEQIVEIKEAVELPLTHPEVYDEIGIRPPKGVILYGPPGTGKTLLARAVANSTSATFLRVVGSELVKQYLGEGPKLVRDLFRTARELAPSIVFIDEIDAIGTKRYNSESSGEREIQRTMLELLNQLDG